MPSRQHRAWESPPVRPLTTKSAECTQPGSSRRRAAKARPSIRGIATSSTTTVCGRAAAAAIKGEVACLEALHREVLTASGDAIDSEFYDSGMRHLMDG